MNTYGSRIKAARESANLTQEGLGQKLGVTGVTIMRYEKNQREPRQDQFKRLAAALNVDVNWLMNGYTLAQRDQAFRDFVKKRFSEVEVWKTGLDEIGQDLWKLNDEGQVEAVKRVKELTEIPRYQVQEPPTAPPQDPPDVLRFPAQIYHSRPQSPTNRPHGTKRRVGVQTPPRPRRAQKGRRRGSRG